MNWNHLEPGLKECSGKLVTCKIQKGNLSVFTNAHFKNNFLAEIRGAEQNNV